jgi:hypothetical protein
VARLGVRARGRRLRGASRRAVGAWICLTPLLIASILIVPVATGGPGAARATGCPSCTSSRSGAPHEAATPTSSDKSGGPLAWNSGAPATAGTLEGAGLATDASIGAALLFGGLARPDSLDPAQLTNRSELYSQTSNLWTAVPAGPAPTPRANFSIGSLPTAGDAVLFGGQVNATTGAVDNATWVYDFNTGAWTNESAPGAPPPRESAAFAIDPAAGEGLLFGGWDPDFSPTRALYYSDLWELNLSTYAWTELTPSGARPPALAGAMLAFDPVLGEFLMFGGCYPCSSDVWAFDLTSNQWTELTGASGAVPTPRADGAWAWDPTNGTAVLFGGTDGVDWFDDTYEYVPSVNEWFGGTNGTAPSARANSAFGWLDVANNESLLLAGGAAPAPLPADLWHLAPTATLRIEVENASDGAPLAGAGVSLDGGVPTRTNGTGSLRFADVDPVETLINVTDLGFADQGGEVWLAPASSVAETFELLPVAPADLSVRVLENGTETARGGVSVALTVAGTAISEPTERTDARGYLNLTDVPTESPAPTAVLVATAPENYSTNLSFPLPPGAVLSELLLLTPYPALHLEVLGELADDVVVPVHEATVVENISTLGLTNPAGWLNVTSSRPSGNVSWTVSAIGFETLTEVTSLPSTGVDRISFTLSGEAFGRFLAAAYDSATSLPLAGVLVTASSDSELSPVNFSVSALTPVSGTATLRVPSGYYNLTASAYGYAPSSTTAPLFVAADGAVGLGFNLTLLPGARVDVLVRVAGGGPAIAQARVALGNLPANATDGAGWANYTNVHFGPTLVNVSAPGFVSNQSLVTLAPEQVIPLYEVNLTPLTPGGNGLPVGTGGFQGVITDLASAGPYLALLAILVLGGLGYLLVVRLAPVTPPEDRGPDDDRPIGLG